METQSKPKTDEPGFCLRMDEPNSGDEFRMCSRGFFIGFKNGYRVSVQFGRTNYCSACKSYEYEGRKACVPKAEYEAWLGENCPDAEVAIWSPEGNLVPFKSNNDASYPDDVRPYTDPETLVKILAWAAELPPSTATT